MRAVQEGSLQAKGFGGGETGALFPRLHVKETKVSGPRAPPRNKMALFEQFTIPPHRFVPPPEQLPSQPCPGVTAFYPPQGSLFDGRYTCSPCYINPTLAYNVQHQMMGQPLLASSSSSSLVSCDREKNQQVPALSLAETKGCSSAVTSDSTVALASKKNPHQSSAKDLNDPNKVRSAKKTPSLDASSESVVAGDIHGWQSWTNSQFPSAKVNHTQAMVAPSSVRKHKVSISSTNLVEAQRTDAGNSTELADADMEKFETRSHEVKGEAANEHHRAFASLRIQYDGSALQTSLIEASEGRSTLLLQRGHHGYQKIADLVRHPEGRIYSIDVDDHAILVEDTVSVGQGGEMDEKRKAEGILPSYHELPSTTYAEACNLDHSKRKETINSTVSNQPRNQHHCSDIKIDSDGSDDVSASLDSKKRRGTDHDSTSSMHDSFPASKIIPRDVIGVIGQREFWKARKAILQQQKIFSVQLFELHRLIKVQQLIATSAGLLIEDDAECCPLMNSNLEETVPTEVCEKLDADASAQGFLGLQKSSVEEKSANVHLSEESNMELSSHALCPNDLNKRSLQISEPNIQSGPAGAPITCFFQGAVGTWGYPSLPCAGNQWLKAMGAQPEAYPYQTNPGGFPPRQVLPGGIYNNSSHPAMGISGPVNMQPPAPLNISGYELRWNDYQTWQSSPNPFMGWYGLSPLVDPARIMSSAGPSEEISTGSMVSHSRIGLSGYASAAPLVPAVGGLLQSKWPESISRQSSVASKDNTSSDEAEQLDQIAHGSQPSEFEKRGFQTFEASGVSHHLAKTGRAKGVNVSNVSESQSERKLDSDSNLQFEEPGHARHALESMMGRQNHPCFEMRHFGAAEATSCEKGTGTDTESSALPLFPWAPVLNSARKGFKKPSISEDLQSPKVIRAVPRAAVAASESAAVILQSIQQERRQ